MVSVLSGNRNFEGRINPDVKMNYLASPAAGDRLRAGRHDGLRLRRRSRWAPDTDGNDVFLNDIWPTPQEVQETIDASINKEMFTTGYADVFAGDERWQSLPTPEGKTFEWDPDSTYVRKPPYFDGMQPEPSPVDGHRGRPGAGQAGRLGDHRPHLPGRLDQGGHPGRRST